MKTDNDFRLILILAVFAVLALIETIPVQAVDFSQPDKQSHALLGCAGASMARGFAVDAGSDYAPLLGFAGGMAAEAGFELGFAAPKSASELKQDILAAGIGSLVCISVAEGVKFLINRNGAALSGGF